VAVPSKISFARTPDTLVRAAAARGWILPITIVLAGVLHRATVLAMHADALRDLVAQNADSLTWQYLPVSALTEQLASALLYLQQTPPLPHVVLGLAAKSFGWPYGTAYTLIVVQVGVSTASAVLLFALLNDALARPILSWAIALVFLLSSDLLVMEYNYFGQTLYENLAMLLLLANVWFYGRLVRRPGAGNALGLALTASGLALTRASFSYYFIVPAAFLAARVIRQGFGKPARRLLVAFLCGLSLQLAWIGKQCVVYGTCSVATSSWAGINFAIGLARVGQHRAFLRSILDAREAYPEWFVRMIAAHGLVHWHPPTFAEYVPPSVRAQDDAIQLALHQRNRSENSIGQRLVADLYLRAYVRFAVRHPRIIADKFLHSYELFWQPIRDYSALYLAPLNVVPETRHAFHVRPALRTAIRELRGGNQYVMTGPWRQKAGRPTRFLTIPGLPALVRVVNVLVLHTVAPFLLAWSLLAFARAPRLVLPAGYLYPLAAYAYGALVMNLGEHGENMRFRLSVEPVIWLVSAYSLRILVSEFVASLRDRARARVRG
jgi:hypothetical protein